MSQFEREIKNALDNFIPDHDGGAWSEMERRMAAPVAGRSSRSTFFGKFIVAGVVLTTAYFGVNMGAGTSDNHMSSDATVAHWDTTIQNAGANEAHHAGLVESDEVMADVGTHLDHEVVIDSMPKEAVKNVSNTMVAKKVKADNLSDAQKDGIISINKSIQEGTEDNTPVTVYVGKNFNLDANVVLTPNGDNKNDYFMPEALKESDIFEMKIYDNHGKFIFATDDVNVPWNGHSQVSGEKVSKGKYRWKVTLHKSGRKEIFTGSIRVD